MPDTVAAVCIVYSVGVIKIQRIEFKLFNNQNDSRGLCTFHCLTTKERRLFEEVCV